MHLALTHQLFVDDVVLFGSGTMDEWTFYKHSLDLLCNASGMCISLIKSSFLYNDVDDDTRRGISIVLTLKMDHIDGGFHYLGYHLKPLGYGVNEWRWIIKIFKKIISLRYFRLLSLGGRLILIRSVLAGMPIYWFSLEKVPKTILNCLRQRILSFLWGNHVEGKCIHLVDWKTLSRPYEYGGWNIKNLEWFGMALQLKIFWVVLKGTSIWSSMIKTKYLRNLSLEDWPRKKHFTVKGTSIFWNGFIITLSWLNIKLGWKVGNCMSIKIGIDPISGQNSSPHLSMEL